MMTWFFRNSGALRRGEIDLAISPTRYLSTIHPSEPLFDDDYVCMAWSGNTEVGERISLEKYLKLGRVVVPFGREQQLPTLEEWFVERFGHQRKIEVVTTAFILLPSYSLGLHA
jgi:DNA-binding transcriptional LysR family regulator